MNIESTGQRGYVATRSGHNVTEVEKRMFRLSISLKPTIPLVIKAFERCNARMQSVFSNTNHNRSMIHILPPLWRYTGTTG